jgi:hypothetical protein
VQQIPTVKAASRLTYLHTFMERIPMTRRSTETTLREHYVPRSRTYINGRRLRHLTSLSSRERKTIPTVAFCHHDRATLQSRIISIPPKRKNGE